MFKLKTDSILSRLKADVMADSGYYAFGMFLILCFILILGMTVWTVIFQPADKTVQIPAPADVCDGKTYNTAQSEDGIVQMDYIDRYGNTVYLVYQIGQFGGTGLKSKQVVPGEDCEQ